MRRDYSIRGGGGGPRSTCVVLRIVKRPKEDKMLVLGVIHTWFPRPRHAFDRFSWTETLRGLIPVRVTLSIGDRGGPHFLVLSSGDMLSSTPAKSAVNCHPGLLAGRASPYGPPAETVFSSPENVSAAHQREGIRKQKKGQEKGRIGVPSRLSEKGHSLWDTCRNPQPHPSSRGLPF